MINKWLSDFKSAWIGKDIDRVLDLFSDDVTYFEMPEEQLIGKNNIRMEWESVKSQEDIHVNFRIISYNNNEYTVGWNLSYLKNSDKNQCHGTYILRFDKKGKCNYFLQKCE